MLLPPFFPCILFLLLSSFTSHISFLRICFSFILIFFRFFSPTYQGRKSSILCLRTSVSAPPLFFWFYFYFISRFPFFFVILIRFCRILFICLSFILFPRLPSSLPLNYIYLLHSTRPLFILFPFRIVLDFIRFSLSISIPVPTSVFHHEISRFFLSSVNQLRKEKTVYYYCPLFLV